MNIRERARTREPARPFDTPLATEVHSALLLDPHSEAEESPDLRHGRRCSSTVGG